MKVLKMVLFLKDPNHIKINVREDVVKVVEEVAKEEAVQENQDLVHLVENHVITVLEKNLIVKKERHVGRVYLTKKLRK